MRIAAAGTPTTARTGGVLAVLRRHERQQVAQQLARRLEVTIGAFLDQPALERPMQIEHGAVVERVAADQRSRLSTLRATRSAGQPTKLSTTNCPPLEDEMALREVPRSMPTLNASSAGLLPRCRTVVFQLPLVPVLSVHGPP